MIIWYFHLFILVMCGPVSIRLFNSVSLKDTFVLCVQFILALSILFYQRFNHLRFCSYIVIAKCFYQIDLCDLCFYSHHFCQLCFNQEQFCFYSWHFCQLCFYISKTFSFFHNIFVDYVDLVSVVGSRVGGPLASTISVDKLIPFLILPLSQQFFPNNLIFYDFELHSIPLFCLCLNNFSQ